MAPTAPRWRSPESALTALTAGAAVLWVLRVGRAPSALRGWVGVALSLSAYDLALNAIGGARFQPVWWSSLSVRVATYGVLAIGCTWSVLGQLRDVELYSDTGSPRREAQLRSAGLTRRLLRCAEDLARAVTPDEVATVLCADAVSMSGAPHAALLVTHGAAHLRCSARPGTTPPCGPGSSTWAGTRRCPARAPFSPGGRRSSAPGRR